MSKSYADQLPLESVLTKSQIARLLRARFGFNTVQENFAATANGARMDTGNRRREMRPRL